MNQQEYCWFCGRSEDACGYLVQSASRVVNFTLKGGNTVATASMTGEVKVHAHICDDCARTCCAIIAEEKRAPNDQGYDAKRGEVATNNPAQEHKE